jgi:hypothetical protein
LPESDYRETRKFDLLLTGIFIGLLLIGLLLIGLPADLTRGDPPKLPATTNEATNEVCADTASGSGLVEAKEAAHSTEEENVSAWHVNFDAAANAVVADEANSTVQQNRAELEDERLMKLAAEAEARLAKESELNSAGRVNFDTEEGVRARCDAEARTWSAKGLHHAQRIEALVALLRHAGPGSDAIRTDTAVGALIEQLQHGSGEEKILAAATLSKLAAWRPENRRGIVDAGAIAPLVALLRQGDADAQVQAAEALQILALDETNTRRIMQAEAVFPLLELLKQGTLTVKVAAAGVLERLGIHHGFPGLAIARHGGLKPLLKLVRHGNARGKVIAANVLGQMGRVRLESPDKASIEKVLTSLLRNGDTDSKAAAAAALTNFETKEFKVEKIVSSRVHRGQKEYYIKWKNFETNAWVDAEVLLENGYKDLIDGFERT